MFASLFVPVALCAAITDLPQVPASELRSQDIELVARATPTRFAALNPSDHAVLLEFHDPSTGARASLVMPAGSETEFRFPIGTLDVLELEVKSFVGGRIVASGVIELASVEEPDVDALWIRAEHRTLVPFAQHGAGFRAIPRDSEGDDERGGDVFAVPPHVPAIYPTGHGQGDKPPKIGDILPPV